MFLCAFVTQLARIWKLERAGVPVEAICDFNKWNEGMVSSVFVYFPYDGDPEEVQTTYSHHPAFEPGDITTVLHHPDHPRRAVLLEDIRAQRRLMRIGASTMGVVTFLLARALL
ncbi:hypothetical protein [Streptomyces luteireticuli]|uniref:DUF3592 domain-containing protein n=1 Tax=Streptomyces luteireticuli TaxID=173858 RepID=A0ABN0YZN7_9ACTN